MQAIWTSELVKTFGSTRALDGLDLEVATGEIHGFLGPNGSGKSTAIRALLGLLHPDSGEARLLGGDPWRDTVALHRRLAYVPGDVELWPNLTGGEVIDLFARLRGGIDTRRRDELCERFSLDPTKKGRSYSKGNRQKVALICALSAEVELLLLDEPTAGLDPLVESVFQDLIRDAAAEGTTVLLSSHILGQVEALADRVSIIRDGAIVESGSLSEMRHLKRTAVTVEIPAGDTPAALEVLGALDGVHGLDGPDEVDAVDAVDRSGLRTVSFEVDAEHIDAVIRALATLEVHNLVARPPTLEQLLLRHYSDTT